MLRSREGLAVVVGFLLAHVVLVCKGSTYTFAQLSGNNQWELAANWNPPGVPGALDDVVIPYGGGYTVTINSQANCHTLLIGGPSLRSDGGPWDPSTAQILSVTNSLAIHGNATVYASGILDITGSGISGLATPQTVISVKGGIVFGTGGTHILATVSVIVEDQAYLIIASETNGVILSSAASITVAQGGNVTLQSQYGINAGDYTPVFILNNGDFYCSPVSEDNFITKISAPFQNGPSGTLHIQTGSITLATNSSWHGNLIVYSTLLIAGGGHQFYDDSNVQGNGTIYIQNADVTFQGAISISNFVLELGSVTVDNANTVTQFNNFQMQGGTLAGTSTQIDSFTWATGLISMSDLSVTDLQIVGAFTGSLVTTPFTVTQQATFHNTSYLLFTNSTFTLAADAQMNFNYNIFFICGKNDTVSALQIGGALQISFPEIITLTCNLIVYPSGVVSATAGAFDIQTQVTSTGAFHITAPASIILETTSTFFPGSSIVGSGALNCQSCQAFIYGYVSIGAINFPAGTITISLESGDTDYVATTQFFNQSGSSELMLINNSPAHLNFTVTNMQFGGGNVTSNHNSQLNLQANLVVTNSSIFSGAFPFLFTNVALINYGTITFEGNTFMKLFQNSIFYNAGTIQLVGGQLQVSQDDNQGYLSSLINVGQFIVSTAATGSKFALAFRNLGAFYVNGGLTLSPGFYTQEENSTCNVARGVTLTLVNPGVFLGGTLSGMGTIAGTVILSGGTLNVDDTSSMTIQTFLQRGNGTLSVDVASTSMLSVQTLCQISGGNLALYSSLPVAFDRQYASAQSVIGSGFANIVSASLNASYGFFVSNNTGGLFTQVVPKPQITQLEPATGPSGTVVTLTGTNFVIGTAVENVSVLFQGVAVPTTVITKLIITATVPIGTGSVSVAVQSDGRISNQQTWTYSPPSIQSISPQSGPTLGSNLVTISGSNFGEDTSVVTVTFGSFGSCSITQLADDQIVCAVPPGVGANVSVTVQAGQQNSATVLYAYAAPTLQSIYPSAVNGSMGSTGTITITGQNLAATNENNNLIIQIGQHTCGNTTQVSITTFTCVPPQAVITATSASYPVKVVVAGQSSTSLTFSVFSATSPSPPSTTNWWPLPWWVWLVLGGAIVISLVLGLVVGCVVAKRSSTPGYAPISDSSEKRRSALIN